MLIRVIVPRRRTFLFCTTSELYIYIYIYAYICGTCCNRTEPREKRSKLPWRLHSFSEQGNKNIHTETAKETFPFCRGMGLCVLEEVRKAIPPQGNRLSLAHQPNSFMFNISLSRIPACIDSVVRMELLLVQLGGVFMGVLLLISSHHGAFPAVGGK